MAFPGALRHGRPVDVVNYAFIGDGKMLQAAMTVAPPECVVIAGLSWGP